MPETRSIADLTAFAQALFAAAGLEADKAASVARLLVLTDAMGHRTHGVAMLPLYLDEIAKGNMTPAGTYEVVRDTGPTVVWDGGYLPGHWLMEQAVALALERVERQGVVSLALRRSHHIGCLAAHLKAVADAGCVASLYNSDPVGRFVAPYGGTEPLFTPNPFAYAYPTAGNPVLVDICASITTVSMTRQHAAEGTRFPHPWLLDAVGQPTTDPTVLEQQSPRGSIQLIGGQEYGHKGFGLALVVEALSQGLSGHGRYEGTTRWGGNVFLQVIDPDAFAGRDALVRETTHLANACRANRPIDPARPVRLPGDAAAQALAAAATGGIVVADRHWAALVDRARGLGVAVPSGT